MARHHMASGDIAAKGNAISKAISIVDNGLKASLDAKAAGAAGTELVNNLSALYDYIIQRLLYANLHHDAEGARRSRGNSREHCVRMARETAVRAQCRQHETSESQAMPVRNEVVQCYGELASAMSLMATLARAREWGRLAELEAQLRGARRPAEGHRQGVAGRGAARTGAQPDRLHPRPTRKKCAGMVKPQIERLMAEMGQLQKQQRARQGLRPPH
jgi:hypothetical protein